MLSQSTTLFRILIINPNTTTSMTDALVAPINELQYTNTTYTYHTNPSAAGPGSINNPTDAEKSTSTILESLKTHLADHDAFLVACFSPHPLVAKLRNLVADTDRPRRPVTGIFEASVAAAMELCPSAPTVPSDPVDYRWGIVTTAEGWREPLSRGVGELCGMTMRGTDWDHRNWGYPWGKFGGVETTGLNADELHRTPREVVDARMAQALGRLVDIWEDKRQRVAVVVLGCAGMVGWEEKIRSEMRRRYQGTDGDVLVIDPVKAGIGSLQTALRAGY